MITRCVNLDWFEVSCLEPTDGPRNVAFFESLRYEVHPRDYGTRVYGEMFVLYDQHGDPFIEVRRAPKTTILSPYQCSLRLVNRYCYFDNAAQLMGQFIERHGYIFQRIIRADICLDFERFDTGDDPYKFIVRYLNGTYSKINQANVHSHGTDRWDGRDWNSLSWGSPVSDIGTKLYDKTLELYDPITKQFKKPYIRQAWLYSGLIDNMTFCTKTTSDGGSYKPRIWRLEFSIRSSVKNWFVIHPDGNETKYQSVPNRLDCYESKDRLLILFFSLVKHYFRFKYYYEGVRKDRCPDKELFKINNQQQVYKVGRDQVASSSTLDKYWASLISKLRVLRERHFEREIHDACDILIKSLEDNRVSVESGSIFTRQEILAFQQAVSLKMKGDSHDFTVLLNEAREFLRLNDITSIF